MAIDPLNLLAALTAFFIASASPGPATLAVATVSMSAGRRSGLMFGLGLSAGLAFWGLIAATGLGALLQASTQALMFLKLGGGLYLIWLAIKSARSSMRQEASGQSQMPQRDVFKQGLLLNLSNPKAVFAWMAVLAIGLGEESGTLQVAATTVFCMVLGAIIYSVYAALFSTPKAMEIYRTFRRWADAAFAGLFAIAGFGLIRSALSRS